MPGARRGRRALDAGEARDAATGQWQRLVDAVGALDDTDLTRPTRLGSWTVAELVAHLARGPASVSAALAADPPTGSAPGAVLDAAAWLTAAAGVADDVDERARAGAAAVGPEALRALVPEAVAAALAALGQDGGPDRLVTARLGTTTLTDLLATRVVEAVVHLRDLQHAVAPAAPADGCPEFHPPAVRLAVRLLTDLLAARAPGRSVEVRVTDRRLRLGHAVQCVPGVRHTRGTPPAVVEVGDAFVWLDLLTGRSAFGEEVAAGRVHASGERSDLTPHLPVLR